MAAICDDDGWVLLRSGDVGKQVPNSARSVDAALSPAGDAVVAAAGGGVQLVVVDTQTLSVMEAIPTTDLLGTWGVVLQVACAPLPRASETRAPGEFASAASTCLVALCCLGDHSHSVITANLDDVRGTLRHYGLGKLPSSSMPRLALARSGAAFAVTSGSSACVWALEEADDGGVRVREHSLSRSHCSVVHCHAHPSSPPPPSPGGQLV